MGGFAVSAGRASQHVRCGRDHTPRRGRGRAGSAGGRAGNAGRNHKSASNNDDEIIGEAIKGVARLDQAKPDCSVMDVKREAGGRMRIHSVCKVDAKTTATTDAVVSGDFSKSYRSDMTVRYQPPMEGMAEMRMVSQGKWLGPCKPGQKHGDVVMPGMPGGNKSLQDMMNDPRMRELMKRQGQDD